MATEWEVTSQNQRDELNDNGRFEPYMEVNYATIPEGIRGQLLVPKRLYDADYVRAQIDAAVKKIKEVQNL